MVIYSKYAKKDIFVIRTKTNVDILSVCKYCHCAYKQ